MIDFFGSKLSLKVSRFNNDYLKKKNWKLNTYVTHFREQREVIFEISRNFLECLKKKKKTNLFILYIFFNKLCTI